MDNTIFDLIEKTGVEEHRNQRDLNHVEVEAYYDNLFQTETLTPNTPKEVNKNG